MSSVTPQRANALATIALGASQALIPRQAGKLFGLGDITDGPTLWLARLLGVANASLGVLGLNEELTKVMRPLTLAALGGDAAVTAIAGATGAIPPRAAISVLAMLGLMLPASLAATD